MFSMKMYPVDTVEHCSVTALRDLSLRCVQYILCCGYWSIRTKREMRLKSRPAHEGLNYFPNHGISRWKFNLWVPYSHRFCGVPISVDFVVKKLFLFWLETYCCHLTLSTENVCRLSIDLSAKTYTFWFYEKRLLILDLPVLFPIQTRYSENMLLIYLLSRTNPNAGTLVQILMLIFEIKISHKVKLFSLLTIDKWFFV